MASEYNSTTDALLSHAREAMREANNAEARIRGGSKPGLKLPAFDYAVGKPNLQPPPNFSDLFPGTDGTTHEMHRLNTELNSVVGKFFPHITRCLKTLPDEWLCDVIGGVKPFGYSQTYFELVWHQARDRATRTRRSEVNTIASEFAGRGFALPPGAFVAAVDAAHQRASDTILEVNREQAIKDAEVKLELLKFAEQQALQYKLGVFAQLADFYKVWVSIPDKDIERARIRAQAASSLYSALSSYHNVEVAFEQLRLRAAEAKVGTVQDNDRAQIALFGADSTANGALGQAVRAFGDISAASANAAGTLVAQIEAV